MDRAIYNYTAKHGILYTYVHDEETTTRTRGGESQREGQGQEEVKRTRGRMGDEKGSKLPDVKFFATNQRGDN